MAVKSFPNTQNTQDQVINFQLEQVIAYCLKWSVLFISQRLPKNLQYLFKILSCSRVRMFRFNRKKKLIQREWIHITKIWIVAKHTGINKMFLRYSVLQFISPYPKILRNYKMSCWANKIIVMLPISKCQCIAAVICLFFVVVIFFFLSPLTSNFTFQGSQSIGDKVFTFNHSLSFI